MGILQNPLGINVSHYMPVVNSPFNNSEAQGQSFPPPGSDKMITEGGDQMITETTLDDMITE